MLSTIVCTLAVCYLAIAALMWFFQEKLVYMPFRKLDGTPANYGLRFEDVVLETEDGVKLHGWFVPAPDEKSVVLFCHGNAGNVSHRLDTLRLLHGLGLSTFIFDYRGYGRSEGKPSEEGTYRDVDAAWQYLTRERGIPAGRIIVFGRSLGGPIAAWAARKHAPRGLILESTFTSTVDLGKRLYPFLPIGLLARIRYPTAAYVRDVQCPVLVAHSHSDEMIPHDLGRRVFEAAPEPKSFLEFRGSHNEGFLDSGADYSEGLKTFIEGLPER
jgi:fermentation-respiration switch protein FrsA (DUF1100 family)